MRRRKKEGLVDVLMLLPWSVTIGFGVIAFVTLRWIVPAFFTGKPILESLAFVSRSMAWIALVVSGLCGLVTFVRSNEATGAAQPPRGDRSEPTFTTGRVAQSASTNMTAVLGRNCNPSAGEGGDEHGASWHEQGRAQPEFSSWTLDALRSLEWKRFEMLCAQYYEAVGFKSDTLRCGADGGIDIKLYKIDPAKPLAVVQCKAWHSSVGVKEIRELFGVMAHEKVGRGVFITTSTFTKEAQMFGAANPIQLLDGADFVQKLCELPQHSKDALLNTAFAGEYRTPSCASCGIKMVSRVGKGKSFWGCANFPRCRNTFSIKQ